MAEKIVSSITQQICARCKGTGKDQQIMGFILFGIASFFIVILCINTHWILGILALIGCGGKLYSLWTNKCKVCNGTGTISSITETITK